MSLSAFSVYALPASYALFVWWLSTGVIIYLDNLPRRTHRWSMLGATVVLAIALHGLHASSTDATASGAYMAFTYGLLIWGWQEMTFFMGFLTGPVREPCPSDCVGWPRFVRAVQSCLYHELATFVSAAAIIAATAHGANQVGTWTYVVLWLMRLSAKFNVFLGVRNLSEEFIPEHLSFIGSFLRHRPMNALFPFSITIPTVIAVLLVQRAAAPGTDAVSVVGLTLIAVLLILAIIEHWLLVLPLPATALWNWSVRARQQRRATTDPAPCAEQSLRSGPFWGVGLPPHLPRLVRLTVPATNHTAIGGDP